MEIKLYGPTTDSAPHILYEIGERISRKDAISVHDVGVLTNQESLLGVYHLGWMDTSGMRITQDHYSGAGTYILHLPDPAPIQNIDILEQFKPHCSGIGDKTDCMCSTMLTSNLPHINEFVKHHSDICQELHGIYTRECSHVATSFHTMYAEEGFSMPRVWFADTFAKFKMQTMSKEKGEDVSNESIRTMLLDIANYAIMTVMEMDREEGLHDD